MAECTIEDVVIPVKRAALSLTTDETAMLYDVLSSIGGHPVKSRRCHADSILAALVGAGVKSTYPGRTDMQQSERTIYFEDIY